MTSRRTYLGFALLCVLNGSGWLLDQAVPGMLSGLLRPALHQVIIALALACLVLPWSALRHSRLLAVRASTEIALGGIAMLALPQILVAAARGSVDELTEVLIYLLTPVVVVFLVAQQSVGFGLGESPLRRLAPALAGLAGAALLIPFTAPPTLIGKVWLAAMALSAMLAGFAAVRLHAVTAHLNLIPTAAIFSGGSALVLGVGCAISRQAPPPFTLSGATGDLLHLALIDAPVLLLTVWLVRRMSPGAFCARYLLVPLVAILGSYVVLRPASTWITWLGVLLLAVGAAALLQPDSQEMLSSSSG